MDRQTQIDKLSETIAQAQAELEKLKRDDKNEFDDEEVYEMAKHLGVDVDPAKPLPGPVRWVAEKALEAPLPRDWVEGTDDAGNTYYYNGVLKKSSWDHPLDDSFRKMMSAAVAGSAGEGGAKEQYRRELLHKEALARFELAQTEASTSGGAQKELSEETEAYAEHLGLDRVRDRDLLWIAEQGVCAPLPTGWREHRTPDGELYYSHAHTGQVSWAHPLDEHFRALVVQMQREKAAQGGAGFGREDGEDDDEDHDDDDDDDDDEGYESDNQSFDSDNESINDDDDDDDTDFDDSSKDLIADMQRTAKSIKDSVQDSVSSARSAFAAAATSLRNELHKATSPTTSPIAKGGVGAAEEAAASPSEPHKYSGLPPSRGASAPASPAGSPEKPAPAEATPKPPAAPAPSSAPPAPSSAPPAPSPPSPSTPPSPASTQAADTSPSASSSVDDVSASTKALAALAVAGDDQSRPETSAASSSGEQVTPGSTIDSCLNGPKVVSYTKGGKLRVKGHVSALDPFGILGTEDVKLNMDD